MGRLAALGVLLCVCAGGCTSFIRSDTKEWFAAPSPPLMGERDAASPPAGPPPFRDKAVK
jgi:hypothetical protein